MLPLHCAHVLRYFCLQGADAATANGNSAYTSVAAAVQRDAAELESMGVEQPTAAAATMMTSTALRQQVRATADSRDGADYVPSQLHIWARLVARLHLLLPE